MLQRRKGHDLYLAGDAWATARMAEGDCRPMEEVAATAYGNIGDGGAGRFRTFYQLPQKLFRLP